MGYRRGFIKLSSPEKYLLDFYQKLSLAMMFFSRNELRNHAAAAAYYMLLSLIPLILVVFYIFDTFLDMFPAFSNDVFTVLRFFNSGISPEMFEKFGISKNVGSAIGIFGILNLMLSSRLILTSMQRAFSVVFPAPRKRNFLLENAISLCLLPIVLILVVVLGVLNTVKGGIYKYLELKDVNMDFIHPLVELIGYVTPALVAFLLVFFAYRYLPVTKPTSRSAFKGALMFVVVFTLVKVGAGHLLKNFMSVGAYGLLGSLILALVWSYFMFLLFYFCAQYVFVSFKGDMLILNRFFDREPPSDKFIAVNRRVLERYSQKVEKGEILFDEGDEGGYVYYVLEGKFDALNGGKKIGDINQGEFFGEMSHITGRPRSATVQSVEESLVAALPAVIFDEILNHNAELSRDLLSLVCGRLHSVEQDDPERRKGAFI